MPELITPADSLYRRILGIHLRGDGSVSSRAFKLKNDRPDPACSVDLARLCSPEQTRARAPGDFWGVVQLSAGVPLSLGLAVEHRPLEDNPAHSEIIGNTSKAHCRTLADAAQVVIAPLPPRRA